MKNKILFVVSLLFALMFINAGLNKFFGYMPMPDPLPEDLMALFTAISSLGWLLPLIGVAEVIGGILVIIPKYRSLGAIIIFPVMVGIPLTHIVNVPASLPTAIVLMAINLWIIFENREKYLPMIR